MASKLFFSLKSIKPQVKEAGSSITHVTSKQVPGFVNISFSLLQLASQSSQEPIWHPNANKLGYCQQGKALVTMRTPSSVEKFTIEKGDMFFIPQGYVHGINNIGSEETIIAFTFSHTDPEIMCLGKAIQSLSDNVFTATFGVKGDFLAGLKKSKSKDILKSLSTKEQPASIASRYKFHIASSDKPILTKGGYLQIGTKTNLPVLNSLGILRFGLNQKGNVEPHWHTNAGELVYIVKGHTRITVLDPAGNIDVMEVNGGEGAFAPASHFHNIENIGNEDVEVIAFFSHAEPDYIGIGEVVGAYSNDVLTSAFGVTPGYFDNFQKPQGPLVIVPV